MCLLALKFCYVLTHNPTVSDAQVMRIQTWAPLQVFKYRFNFVSVDFYIDCSHENLQQKADHDIHFSSSSQPKTLRKILNVGKEYEFKPKGISMPTLIFWLY